MKPSIKATSLEELLARELHRQYRAAAKSNGIKGIQAHDHGPRDCGALKFKYFQKRAKLMLKRANTKPLSATLGEMLDSRNAEILSYCIQFNFDASDVL